MARAYIKGKPKEYLSKEVATMGKRFTLEYWIDEGWYVGRLKEVPGVFSQGETLEELEKNIREAYQLIMEDEDLLPSEEVFRKELELQV